MTREGKHPDACHAACSLWTGDKYRSFFVFRRIWVPKGLISIVLRVSREAKKVRPAAEKNASVAALQTDIPVAPREG